MSAYRTYFRSKLFKLFELNEHHKLSDADLLHFIRIQFPEVNTIGYGKARTKLSRWRSEYNTGRLGTPVKVPSFRYVNGVAVNQRLKPLDPEIVARLKEEYARNSSQIRRSNQDR